MSRDDAYRLVQETAQRAWDTRTPFRDLLARRRGRREIDLDAVFDPSAYLTHAGKVFDRLEAEITPPGMLRLRRPL